MSKDIDFSINLENLKAIPFDKYPKDFIFIVNGKRYETSRIVADLLSPIIRNFHYQDQTLNEFVINTTMKTNEKDYFPDFLELANFDKIFKLTEAQQKYYKDYFLHLGNIDEYLRLQQNSFSDISVDNVIDYLQKVDTSQIKSIFKDKNVYISNCITKLIDFSASHFDEISKDKMKELNETVLEEIIRNDALKLENEDELLEFVLDLYETDHKYSNLFEYIQFENVEQKTIERFIEIFSIEDINYNIWKAVCQRFSQAVEVKVKNNKRYKKNEKAENFKEFQYKNDEKFNGIMNYLITKTGGNIHDNGTIEITSNASDVSNNPPKNLVDYQNMSENHYFQSNAKSNEPNKTILFDFKNRKVQLTNYSIESCRFGGKSYCNLRNWVVEVSNDKSQWEIVDRHENDSTLNNDKIKAVFNTNGNNNSFYRFVQIRQTGISWFGDAHLYISRIEFFGKLKE